MSEKENIKKTISPEAAKLQVDEMFDYYGLSQEHLAIENGPQIAQTIMNFLTAGVREGRLEVSTAGGDLKVTQFLMYPVAGVDKLVFTDKIGNANIASEKAPSTAPESRRLLFLCTLADTELPVVQGLKGKDLALFNKIAVVFMMV